MGEPWWKFWHCEPSTEELIVRSVLALLEDREGWTRTSEQTISHETGLLIWIANEDYGLNFSIDGSRVGPYNTSRGAGVETTPKQRRMLHEAVLKLLGPHGLNEAAVRQFASNVLQFRKRA